MHRTAQSAKPLGKKWGQSPAKDKDSPEAPLPTSDLNFVICDSPASLAECMTPAYGIKMCFHRKGKLVMHVDGIKICEQKKWVSYLSHRIWF